MWWLACGAPRLTLTPRKPWTPATDALSFRHHRVDPAGLTSGRNLSDTLYQSTMNSLQNPHLRFARRGHGRLAACVLIAGNTRRRITKRLLIATALGAIGLPVGVAAQGSARAELDWPAMAGRIVESLALRPGRGFCLWAIPSSLSR